MDAGQASIPRILVVDDEFGLPELLHERSEFVAHEARWRAHRAAFCRQFGLVSELADAGDDFVADPVARARFVSGLRWEGGRRASLREELVVKAIEGMRLESPPGPALVLLDLQFRYGVFGPDDGEFSLVSSTFGSEDIIQLLRERYGTDPSSPGASWTAIPVVIVSAMPKEAMDGLVRSRGARGMMAKRSDASPEECRQALKTYLESHGLLPDPRSILVGESLPFLNAMAAARRAAAGASSVLLLGESGTGKELLARYVHDMSPRSAMPYRVFHAAGRGDELQEDELFGHWAGAFTGAGHDRPGLLEEASGGTLFIDEIGDLAPRVQNALMRPLEERVVSRIGRPRLGAVPETHLDLVFVFATNKNLRSLTAEGRFKSDLLARIEEVTVTLPPLRERSDDIPLLAAELLARLDDEVTGRRGGGARHHLDDQARDSLRAQTFAEGNIRQLRNLLLRAILVNPGEPRITAAELGGGPAEEMVSQPQASVPTSDSAVSPGHCLAALHDWLAVDPLSRPIGEARAAADCLAGMGAQVIVSLIEASYLACRVRGRFSLPRLMAQVWGVSTISPQDARRSLIRLLNTEWGSGAVARAARKSPVLAAEPQLAHLIHAAARRWEETHG